SRIFVGYSRFESSDPLQEQLFQIVQGACFTLFNFQAASALLRNAWLYYHFLSRLSSDNFRNFENNPQAL
ncbi:MAG: hypothetical protein SOV46_01145, partial [Candidatus Faecousia sp.]|nr:hypothetical protein [Candidatus Faecousia sp.]